MAVAWPSTLQDKVNESGFNYEYPDTTIRSSMDVGMDKARRRYTKGIAMVTVTIWVDRTQYATFDTFYGTSLNGGVLTFNFTNPITLATREYRFKGGPKVRHVGGDTFEISMVWEELAL